MVCVRRCTKNHKLLSPVHKKQSNIDDVAADVPVDLVSVCFHSTSQISGFDTSEGISEGRKDGPLYHRHLGSVAALLRMVENRAES